MSLYYANLFNDQLSVPVHVHVARTVVTDPREEDIAAPANLRHH
jgi:hypothetical protein